MKALTLWPEWAHAVAHLGKRIENRTWPPPRSIIGQRIAIHAGAHIGGRPGRPATEEGMEAVEMRCFETDPIGVEWDIDPPRFRRPRGDWREVVTGAVVCTAVVERATDAEARGEVHYLDVPHPWAWGDPSCEWWWHLADVQVLDEPIPCRGSQGLWVPRMVEEAE